MRRTCKVTDQDFDVTPEEMMLRKKLGVEGEPKLLPVFRFMELGAFWQHWNLYKRKCDKTGRQIISVFSDECPYPVWHKDEWIKDADPPGANFDPSRAIFEQMWSFFSKSPIAHNIGAGNENCEYTDDFWYCKNCYLCHSGVNDEDLRYCYRVLKMKDSHFGVFSFESERTRDLINSHNCFDTLFALFCRSCSESAFLYDCRNCNHCFLCSNLRNKQYCFGNEQLSKEEYQQRMQMWDLRSRATYERATLEFDRMLRERSWHRALFIDQCEGSSGNYLDECKNCTNCFFLSNKAEDCINMLRGGVGTRDSLDCVGFFASERLYCCSMTQDQCYDVRFGYNVVQSKWMEYCAHCFQCEHCFGCCGLVGRKYHIFNKPYSPEEYEKLKAEIITKMKETKEYGRFFPSYFSANAYEESLSGFHWPLPNETAKKLGFRVREKEMTRAAGTLDLGEIPDRSDGVDESLPKKAFWDDAAKRQFQIQAADIEFAKMMKAPLPNSYYARRLQENFRMIPFDGTLRETACSKCKKETSTSWPKVFDGRILCEECYLKEVY